MSSIINMVNPRKDRDKFVSPQTTDEVRVPNAGGKALGDGFEQFIADRVAQRVVDGLEVVQIDEHHCELPSLTARDAHRLGQLFV